MGHRSKGFGGGGDEAAHLFLLWHVHRHGDDLEDEKLIGVYSTEQAARAAQDRVFSQPGFRDQPEGFEIASYRLDRDNWLEGFVSLVTIMMPLLEEGVDVWRPVQAEVLPNGLYRIVSENDSPDDEHWAFKAGAIVGCEERQFDGEQALVAMPLLGDST
jgi:hypothetical protein